MRNKIKKAGQKRYIKILHQEIIMMKIYKVKFFEEAYCQQKKEQYKKIEKKTLY